jgi:hypothetical protein
MYDTHDSKHLVLLVAGLLAACDGQPSPPRTNEPVDAASKSVLAAQPDPASTDLGQRSCVGCELPGWDFRGRTLIGINFLDANLRGADFTGATLRGVELSGANLEGANFSNARIEALEGHPTRFARAKLGDARFVGASLDGADFQHAAIDCADLVDASLGEAVLDPSLACGKARVTADTTTAWQCPNVDVTQLDEVVYVSPSGTDGSTCGGSASSPCQTLSTGLARCSGSTCSVLAYWGTYSLSSSVALVTGASIYGGCLTSTPESTYTSLINAPAGGVPAFVANGVSSAQLQGLSVVGTKAPDGAGAASVAINLTGGSAISFAHVSVTGGAGGAGSPGNSGTSGNAGGNASGQSGGSNASCSTTGGQGGVGMTTDVEYNMSKITDCPSQCSANGCDGYQGGSPNGGSGGGQGSAICEMTCLNNCPSGLNGWWGNPGNGGSCGTGGTASTNVFGGYVDGTWQPTTSSEGQPGADGGGGGGGGGGAACGYVCFWVPDNKSGGSGGGGGAGGCGAPTAGTGGQQGGASIAVQAIASTVEFEQVTITAGGGGNGGIGGSGAAGGGGGAGSGGVTPSGASPVAGTGGGGGGGGSGGSSGGGAGGNGGPSYGVVFVDSSQNSVGQDAYVYTGSSGNVGDGGETPTSAGGLSCSSTQAVPGKPGKVATVWSFTSQS